MAKRDKQGQGRRDGNGSSNGQNAPSGNGGEGRSGRLSQIKNHKGPGDEVLNEFISGEDLYDH